MKFQQYLSALVNDNSAISPRTRAANLAGVRGKGTSSKPVAKRARIDRSLAETLDKMAESNAEIEKLRIEAGVTMH